MVVKVISKLSKCFSSCLMWHATWCAVNYLCWWVVYCNASLLGRRNSIPQNTQPPTVDTVASWQIPFQVGKYLFKLINICCNLNINRWTRGIGQYLSHLVHAVSFCSKHLSPQLPRVLPRKLVIRMELWKKREKKRNSDQLLCNKLTLADKWFI